jgi:hypothetical protein
VEDTVTLTVDVVDSIGIRRYVVACDAVVV